MVIRSSFGEKDFPFLHKEYMDLFSRPRLRPNVLPIVRYESGLKRVEILCEYAGPPREITTYIIAGREAPQGHERDLRAFAARKRCCCETLQALPFQPGV